MGEALPGARAADRSAAARAAPAPDADGSAAARAAPAPDADGSADAIGALTSAADALRLASPLLSMRPLLLASDFDGTLAHLDMDPWGARIVPAARRALRRLAAVDGVHVALISGRAARDLAGRARVGGVTYLGNHGVERGYLGRGRRIETMVVAVEPAPERCEQVARLLADRLPDLVLERWLVVERKLPTVCFHFRGAPDVPAARARVRDAIERLDPEGILVRFPGRRAIELRPPGATAKGEAMRALLDEHRPAAAFMLGDDRNDAAAFRVLAAARSSGEVRGLAVCVAGHTDATLEIAPLADLVLPSPADSARFLGGMARVVVNSSRPPDRGA